MSGDGVSRAQGILVWVIVLVGGLGLVALITAAPALRLHSPRLSALIYAVFAPLCHQIPEKCFFYRGFPMAVCGRCAGIYAGFAAGAGIHPVLSGFVRPRLPSLRVLAAFTVPITIDAAANLLHAWRSSNGIRFASGFIWGVVLPYFVIPAIQDLVMTSRRRRRERQHSS
jgi:uncharacterized membrane protein